MSTWIGRRHAALLEAAKLLQDLKIDQTQQIDVFDAIRRLGVWLTFQPLHHLLGACLPTGSGGIIITSQRRPPIQRYTAAHEIGHWILDQHQLALDREQDVFRPSGAERERLAQVFAGYFLMPPALLHAVAGHHGLDQSPTPQASQIYLTARDLGVSYEAALRQLAELNYLSDDLRDKLLQVSPLSAKQSLAHGIRPVDGNADVWPVDEYSNGTGIDLSVNDELIITLPENRTTGYRWMDDAGLRQRGRHPIRSAPAAFSESARNESSAPVAWQASGVHDLPDIIPPIQLSEEAQGGMRVVADAYSAGWADLESRDVRLFRRSLRRAKSGSEVPSEQFGPISGEGMSRAKDRASGHLPTPGIGATGRRWLAVQARVEGNWRCVLHYAAAHDASTPAVMTFAVESHVRPDPAVMNRRALLSADLDRVGFEKPTRP